MDGRTDGRMDGWMFFFRVEVAGLWVVLAGSRLLVCSS